MRVCYDGGTHALNYADGTPLAVLHKNVSTEEAFRFADLMNGEPVEAENQSSGSVCKTFKEVDQALADVTDNAYNLADALKDSIDKVRRTINPNAAISE